MGDSMNKFDESVEISINQGIIEHTQTKKSDLDILKENIYKLINENKKLKAENKLLKLQLDKSSKIKNERGAGRKQKFTDNQVEEIRALRENGNSIREISKKFNCSVGLVHKLINKN